MLTKIKAWLRDCIKPRVFVTSDLTAYGIRKPNFVRAFLCLIGRLPKLHKPAQTVVHLTDMLSLGNNPSDAQKQNYLEERADVIQQMIDGLGWRGMFVRAAMEVPQEATFKAQSGTKRETKFYVF